MSQVKIAPSLLACDFGRVSEEIQRCTEAGADLIHLDLMDGHFVPNLSFGFPIVKAAAEHQPSLPRDVHLMVSNPGDYVDRLADIGVYQITVHWEACTHLHRVLGAIRSKGIKAGVAFNPHTPVELVEPVMDLVDCLLIMTVNPGFGGQSFLQSQIPKIKRARELAATVEHPVYVSVDGGVSAESAPGCVAAGADLLVAGSYLFKSNNMIESLRSLRSPVV